MESIKSHYTVKENDFSHAGNVSSNIKQQLKLLGLPPQIIKRFVVSIYEAEINQIAHAYGGNIDVEIDEEKIVAYAVDNGPGIGNIELAMQKGYSTASDEVRQMGFGAGMGLPNIKKNSDEFEIESEVGKGTKLKILIYHNKT